MQVVSSEKLSASVQEKDASLLEMKTQMDLMASNLRAAQDMITACNTEKEAAEREKQLAVEKSVHLAQELESAIAERQKADALVAEIESRQKQVEAKAEEVVEGVTKLCLEKEEASISRVDNLLRVVDARHQEFQQKFEDIIASFDSEADKLEGGIHTVFQVLEKQMSVASRVEAAEALCKGLEEKNQSLHSENLALQERVHSLEDKDQEQRQKSIDLEGQLDEALIQQQVTAQQLFAITADYQAVMQSFSEKHVVDISVDRGATPVQEEELTSSLANMATSNASKVLHTETCFTLAGMSLSLRLGIPNLQELAG